MKAESLKLLSVPLFVDASGWLAYLDERDPNHAEAVERVREATGSILTSDCALSELGHIAQSRVDSVLLASLVWQLWEGQSGELLKVAEDDELLAWKLFRRYSGPRPSFADCTSVVLLNKHKINLWLSFNEWLPKMTEEV